MPSINQSETETVLRLLRSAVDRWPEFDSDAPVNGAELVEWFALWRAGVKASFEFIEKRKQS